jgi:MFS family permease
MQIITPTQERHDEQLCARLAARGRSCNGVAVRDCLECRFMATQSKPLGRASIPLRATVILVGTLGSIYMVSQFLRNSIAVIAPNIAQELDLSASEIGLLASAFFFSFAAAQIPLGIALDRYGPKTCMLVCGGIAAFGAVIFAVATSPGGLIAARVLMGLGSSCYLMAPLALYARRYAPHQFASLTGIQMGLGSIGTLIATAPFAFAVAAIGWRATFFGVALLMVLVTVGVMLVVQETDQAARFEPKKESLAESLQGLKAAIRTPSVVPIFFLHLVTHASFVLVVGLWGGPYLTHIYGYDLTARGNMLFTAAVAQVAAAFLWGPTDRLFRSYKKPVLLGAISTALTLGVVGIFGKLPPGWLLAWFILVGALSAYTPVMIAHGKSLFPPHLVGRGITLLNMGTMGGVFLAQVISGFLIDLFPVKDGAYAFDAYRLVFGLQAGVMVAACAVYALKVRDPWREQPGPAPVNP